MSVPGGPAARAARDDRDGPDSGGQDPAREVPVEDERSADDRDEGWGDAAGGLDDEWYLSQRPPHWD
ncbi:hypothetical protein [Kineococcus arenarius]|uniref:hypothetical protein n=1 Tax=unclassified Kineococcus TaxID=2621656 RepID=UPI003D7CF462